MEKTNEEQYGQWEYGVREGGMIGEWRGVERTITAEDVEEGSAK